MQITFVNHAGFICETEDICLLCDPWTEGLAFNNGWALLSPTPENCIDYSKITHIWFSHEHPDHFSPGALKAIPEQARRQIAVIFQETKDKRVVDFCKKLGFKTVTEMQPDQWMELGPATRALCNPQIDEWQGDSWLCLQASGECMLNVNDCGIYTHATAQSIAEKIGPVDLLCTQFSYAAWQGNADDVQGHKRQAARQLMHVKAQIEAIRPRYVLPFASFVWFCHEENYFLNEGMNEIGAAARWITDETSAQPIVLYPGDKWAVGEHHDWHSAAQRYASDMQQIRKRHELLSSHPVEPTKLLEHASKFVSRTTSKSSDLLVRVYLAMESFRNRRATKLRSLLHDAFDLARLNVEPARIFVTDQKQAYEFCIPGGLRLADLTETECDISMAAESLDHCFLIDWGGETLLINGRYQEPHGENKTRLDRGDQARRWFKFTDLSRRLNMGFRLDWGVAREALAWRIKNLFGLKHSTSSS